MFNIFIPAIFRLLATTGIRYLTILRNLRKTVIILWTIYRFLFLSKSVHTNVLWWHLLTFTTFHMQPHLTVHTLEQSNLLVYFLLLRGGCLINISKFGDIRVVNTIKRVICHCKISCHCPHPHSNHHQCDCHNCQLLNNLMRSSNGVTLFCSLN